MAKRKSSASRSRSARRKYKTTSATCDGGSRKKGRKHTKRNNVSLDEKSQLRWRQRGCQNQSGGGGVGGVGGGGGSMFGGVPWAASTTTPTQAPIPASVSAPMNGNHYSFNSNTQMPPLASNAIVEARQMSQQFIGGGRKGRKGRKQTKRTKSFVYQKGGMTQYLPMSLSNTIRGMTDSVSGTIHNLQGNSTAYRLADPTIQPIANTSQTV